MSSVSPQVLVIDDDSFTQRILERHLSKAGIRVTCVSSGPAGLAELEINSYDVVLLDVIMPEMGGIEVLKSIRKAHPEQMVVMLTANASIQGAVEALRLGAHDYYQKPLELDRVEVGIRNALEVANLRNEVVNLRGLLSSHFDLPSIVGFEGGLKRTLQQVQRVTNSNVPVLIRGESGTGKELIARAIHYNGPRQTKPFVTINCSAIPDNLLESELFGHEKGAFTGALSQKKGRFERAHKGTLFLDEIGDMKLELQAKLLRVLQEQEFERVGGTQTIRVDVRIISATHQNLEEKIARGEFREDLYYRLAVYPVSLPPLRERREDIPSLARAFLREAGEQEGKRLRDIAPDAMKVLQRYPWPGNVRELQNVMRRSVVDCEGELLNMAHLPRQLLNEDELQQVSLSSPGNHHHNGQKVLANAANTSVGSGGSLHVIRSDGEGSTTSLPSESFVPPNTSLGESGGMLTGPVLPFDDYEHRIILKALQEAKGDPSEASRLLQISRATIYRKIQRYNIHLQDLKRQDR